MACNFKAGTYTGTGAAITLEIGFIPEFVIITNITDGDTVSLWYDGMAADTNVDIILASATNAADGITRYTGTVGANSTGLTLGTDLSESTDVYRYVAFGSC